MTAQEIACQQAFTSGDLVYYNAAGCSMSTQNDQLISSAKSSVNTKTVLIAGAGMLAAGLLIFLTTRSK